MNKKFALITATLLSLGVGLYGILGPSGNIAQSLFAVSSAAADSCEVAVERSKVLAEKATGELAAFREMQAPVNVGNIAFVDAQGKPKTLANWKGKTILFNLWATWCPPCREEMPWLEELQVKRGGESFAVVPVSIDLGDATKPKAFYEETGLKAIPFLHDNTMESFQQLKRKAVALGMPTTVLVDENSCALGVLNGPAQWASDDAFRLIDAALGRVN